MYSPSNNLISLTDLMYRSRHSKFFARHRFAGTQRSSERLSFLIARLAITLAFVAHVAVGTVGAADEAISGLVRQYCVGCHSDADADSGLDLEMLPVQLDDANDFRRWVQVLDRVERAEMPPSEAQQPDRSERDAFLAELSSALIKQNRLTQASNGRVQFRRLNRFEYENTLRDLLALPNLEVSEMLPADSSSDGFDNVGSALDLSYVQISRYLEAANHAIDKAMLLTPQPQLLKTRLEARTNGRFSQVLRKGEEAVPIGDAVGLLRQPNTAQAPWWWSKFAPPLDGYYRLRMKTFGFTWNKGNVQPADRIHAVTYHAVQGSTKRPLGTFDIGRSAEDASIHEFTPYIRRGDQIQLWFETLDDRNKGRQRPMNQYTAPGVAVEWIEIEGPLVEQWPPKSYASLFGDLPIQPWTSGTGLREPPLPMIIDGVGKRAKRVQAKRKHFEPMRVVSRNPLTDARRLLVDFASRAFRRPVEPSELTDILNLVEHKINQKHCFQEAMRVGFQAILCAPEFLFLHEQPGKLDSYALASRLSYFLWSSLPDDELLRLAGDGSLHRSAVLRKQVDRMLGDPKATRFVESYSIIRTNRAIVWIGNHCSHLLFFKRELLDGCNCPFIHTFCTNRGLYILSSICISLSGKKRMESNSCFVNWVCVAITSWIPHF